ncbi:hypothetical protein [Actinosynnema sp. NPDC023587]|uniref:hypothetical protein n=1 Tax=Actinosynnema sp. NPDC023587 TaxID=3154695 RepID=UPI0034024BE6
MAQDENFRFVVAEERLCELADNQTGQVVLRGDIHAAKINADVEQAVVYVDLSDSTVSAVTKRVGDPEPAGMAWDNNQDQGYFLERIAVLVTATTQDGEKLELRQNAPQTTHERGTVSSHVDYSLGADEAASIGFFGEEPTGSVSAGVHEGISWGNSYSREIQDFEVDNQSTGTEAAHFYDLRAHSGGRYDDWKSLIHNDITTFGIGHIDLVHPVNRTCVSNVPIASQAVFSLPRLTGEQHLVIDISITATFRRVWAETADFLLEIESHSHEITATATTTKVLYP